jgi:hypothetical protein
LPSAIINIPPDFALSFIEDDSAAYQKTAPENSLPYAQIKKIGGMTYKSKNLVPFPYLNKSKTEAGITWTLNDNGSVSAIGTATENSIFYLYDVNKFPIGISKGTTVSVSAGSGASSIDTSATFAVNYYREDGDVGAGTTSVSNGISNTWTVPQNATGLQLYLIVINGITVDHTIYPQIELGTTETGYEPYFEGLRNAAVEEVKSEGVNKFDISKAIKSNGSFTVSNGAIVWTPYGEGDFFAFGYWLDCKPNTNYTVSLSAVSIRQVYVYTDTFYGNRIFYDFLTGGKLTFNSGENTRLLLAFYSIGSSRIGTSETISNIQVEKGIFATEYKPFIGTIDTFAIPQAVKEIDGYGCGIKDNVHNYADFIKKQFVDMLGRIYEPKVLSVGKHENGQLYAIVHSISGKKPKANGVIISTNYDSTSWSDNDKMVYTISDNIIINDSRFSSIEEAQRILNQEKTIIYYELEMPEVTDISSLLAENNFIKVEGGGNLTFENEHGYAVPSTVKYVLGVG